MKLPIFQIDAFTSRVFGGNPAAVVLMDEWLADDRLLAIAAENNLPETAFVIARPDVAPLRWFTPTIEMDVCGHATLAAVTRAGQMRRSPGQALTGAAVFRVGSPRGATHEGWDDQR